MNDTPNAWASMTLEEAKANDMWNWVEVKVEDDQVKADIAIVTGIMLDRELIASAPSPQALLSGIAMAFADRANFDMQELSMVLAHKVTDAHATGHVATDCNTSSNPNPTKEPA